MNRIIFGGAFDPVHNGHINMAEKAAKALNGQVIFVPARISVWKEVSAPTSDKINMLRLAIEGHPDFFIDKYEINSGEKVNYSIDTAKHFRELYPNDNLFYLIGADQVNEFRRWKDALELSKIVHIIFFNRPGFTLNEDNIKEFNMLEINGGGIDVSSTRIRELKSFDLPDEVLFYIVENDLYEGMKKLNEMETPHRLSHSKSVAKTAYQIAKANKVKNPIKAYIAGLFHDVGKDIPLSEQKELTQKYFPKFNEQPEFAYHQFAGAAIAKTLFEIEDQDIIEAIEFHSTGNENMCELAKIIYASDKIEPTRGFDSSELINAMMNGIDSGFKTVLQANKDFLVSKEKSIENPLTFKCFKQYL